MKYSSQTAPRTTNPTGKVNVSRHDGYAFGMYCTQISVFTVFNKHISGLRAIELTRLQISEPSKLLQPLEELIEQNSAIEYPRLHDH